jgi:hypothetical protein
MTDFAPYHKVAEDGIVLGLRRYQFFGKYSWSYNTIFGLSTILADWGGSYCRDVFYISWLDTFFLRERSEPIL